MRLSIWAAAVVFFQTAAAWGAEAPPLRAYVDDTTVSHTSISPSGSRVAYRVARDGDDAVYVVDIKSGEVLFSAQFGDAQVRGLRYMHDDYVLMLQHVPHFHAEYGDNGFLWLKMIDLTIGRVVEASSRSGTAEFYARSSSWPPTGISADGAEIFAAGRRPDDPARNDTLFKMNLAQGLAPRVEASGTKGTIDWFAGVRDGRFVREDYDADDNRNTITVIGADDERVLYEDEGAIRKIDVVGLTRDEQNLVYRSIPPGAAHEKIFTMSIADGTSSGPLLEGPSIWALRDANRRVFGFRLGDFPMFEYRFLDAGLGKRFAIIRQSFPQARVEFVTVSDDLQHLVVRISEDWSKAYYLLYSAGADKPAVVAKEQRQLGKNDVAAQRLHSYVMPDGSPVRALVTARDETLAAGSAPAIVLANWGANTLSGGDYDWVAQYFASLGYLVVQPETRHARYTGSFSFQDRPGWATTPVADADFVLSQLVAQELVDPQRLCIVGFGAGGYTALVSGYESAHAYRCVASHRGYVDVHSAVKRMRDRYQYDDPEMVEMQREYGFASFDKDDVRLRSPIEHAAEYEAPVLLLYSNYDARAYETRAKDMEKALDKQGKSVRVVKLKSKDVRFLKADGRAPAMRALADFVAEHNPATK